MSDKEFTEGIWFKDPHQKAPDFVIGALNIKRMDFMKWLAEKEGDYVNLKILRSRAGKPYLEVDNWKPTNAEKPDLANNQPACNVEQTVTPDFIDDDVPF